MIEVANWGASRFTALLPGAAARKIKTDHIGPCTSEVSRSLQDEVEQMLSETSRKAASTTLGDANLPGT